MVHRCVAMPFLATLVLLAFACSDDGGTLDSDGGTQRDGTVADQRLSDADGARPSDGRTADLPASDGEADGPGPVDGPTTPPYACPAPASGGTTIRVGSGEQYQSIADGIGAAQAGDVVVVSDGTYAESLSITSGGNGQGSRLTLCAEHRRQATVSSSGRVLVIDAPWVTVKGLVLDGEWGDRDVVRVKESSSQLVLSDLEVKNSTRDGIDLGGGSTGELEDVLIESCTVHHVLAGSTSDQKDAHGIVATDFRDLTIRDTEIYYSSGDAVQVGTDRDPWDGLLIDGCEMWTGPLPAAAAGFQKGETPGENALDTKAEVYSAPWHGTITLRDSTFRGFDPASAYISNRAALNLKNQITGVVERCTVSESEIGLRIRGGTGSYGGVDGLVVRNVVLHDNQYHARLEDDAESVQFLHNTFGRQIDSTNAPAAPSASSHYKGGGGGDEGPGWVSNNNLFVGATPALAETGDVAVTDTASTFVDMPASDYHLKKQMDAPAGVGVQVDRDRKPRSASSPDVGAYEL